ncbi:MAG: hypothetical protein LBM70_02430 [Victivallales bacterium]|jgi:hypothetical protein|nr:hypothetical protein [Victivallales bacterium]
MPNAKELIEKARELLKQDAVIITGAEYKAGVMERIQLYFRSENDVVMDIIDKDDLVQNFPDEGVYALTDRGLKRVEMFEGKEDMFFRIDGNHTEEDDFGTLPTVRFMETVEGICSLRF